MKDSPTLGKGCTVTNGNTDSNNAELHLKIRSLKINKLLT